MDLSQSVAEASPSPEPSSTTDLSKQAKPPVIRGARACTVCRAAKMKCVGTDEGQPCQRCKRSGTECVFEKHRRGRKPGSKLSEASKMLRRLEKGLNTAKLKSQTNESSNLPYPPDNRSADRFPNNELPPLNIPPTYPSSPVGSASRVGRQDDDYDTEKTEESMYPAKLINQERNSTFFKTILNPEPCEPTLSRPASERSHTADDMRARSPHVPRLTSPPVSALASLHSLQDPISAGIMDERKAEILFDLFFLRLNPFINLFDPALHTVHYVRKRCSFLFTTILMGCCKFFAEESYKHVQQLANDFAVKAFAEGSKRVEVCQAFACLTYWGKPEENRTWTYIGYACRMAVELGLNAYVAKRPADETDFQFLERRNRERTYMVLFVHDRSLSTQTGRQWMLNECELIRRSTGWHEEGGSPIRPEDVILAAFVQLRLIASETTEVFASNRGAKAQHSDMNYDVLLRNCNGKLNQWSDTWQHEMQRAGGEKFHFAFLSFFRLYVRLFLNSFGINGSQSSGARTSPGLAALSACYTSALEGLQIIAKDFASIAMLRYSQESITTMTAYSAVFLLRLLRSSNTMAQLHEGATEEIHTSISNTADAYHDASTLSSSSSSLAHHARFLRQLITQDNVRAKQLDKERYHQQQQNGRTSDTRYASSYAPSHPAVHSPTTMYTPPSMSSVVDHHSSYHYSSPPGPSPASATMPGPSSHTHQVRDEYPSSDSSSMRSMGYDYGSTSSAPALPQPSTQPQPQLQTHTYSPQQAYQATDADVVYQRHVYRELGFETTDGTAYGAVSGCALTMPNSGHFNMVLQPSTSYDPPPQQHQPPPPQPQHQPPQHAAYSRYHPYPPTSYSAGHGAHAGYSGLAAR